MKVLKGSQDYTYFTEIFQVKSLPSIFLIDKGIVCGVFAKSDESLTPESFADKVASLVPAATITSTPVQLESEIEQPVVATAESERLPEIQPESPDTPAPADPVQAPLAEVPVTTEPTTPSTMQATTSETPPTTSTTITETPAPSTPPPASSSSAPRRLSSNARPSPSPSPNPKMSHDASALKYQESLRKQRKQDQEERKRILRLLEIDREERRRKAQQRKQQAAQQSSSDTAESSSTPPHSPISSEASQRSPVTVKKSTNKNKQYTECALLIRLFDGTALKQRFKATQTLADVRIWVDESRTDGTHPYSFFQPMVRKTYGDGEETQTLLELELAPSASLVLKPAGGQVYSAYGSGEGSAAQHSYSLLQRGAASVAGALYTFLGIGYTPPPRNEGTPVMASSDAALVREAAAAALEMRAAGASSSSSSSASALNSEGITSGHENNGSTSSIIKSGVSSPRPVLSSVSSSVSLNRHLSSGGGGGTSGGPDSYGGGLGINASAANSSSTLNNIRTIHNTRSGTHPDGDDNDDDRITYNGNQLSLEDDRDNSEEKK